MLLKSTGQKNEGTALCLSAFSFCLDSSMCIMVTEYFWILIQPTWKLGAWTSSSGGAREKRRVQDGETMDAWISTDVEMARLPWKPVRDGHTCSTRSTHECAHIRTPRNTSYNVEASPGHQISRVRAREWLHRSELRREALRLALVQKHTCKCGVNRVNVLARTGQVSGEPRGKDTRLVEETESGEKVRNGGMTTDSADSGKQLTHT